MNEFILKQPHTLKWTEELSKHLHWKNFKFKKLTKGYPPFNFPPNLITEVDIEQFEIQEDEVIPLFIGSQFGLSPNISINGTGAEKPFLIAILNKSLLSGVVAGLQIGFYDNGCFREIECFKN